MPSFKYDAEGKIMKILVLQQPLAFTLAYYILLYGHILVLQTDILCSISIMQHKV